MDSELRAYLKAEVSKRKLALYLADRGIHPELFEKINHGTYYSYRKKGCRCDKCKKANSDAKARVKEKKRKLESERETKD